MFRFRKEEANRALQEIAGRPFFGVWGRDWYDGSPDIRRDKGPGYSPDNPWFDARARSEIHELVKVGGADVNATDGFGNTPLLIAIAANNDSIALTLIRDFKADINKANKYGETPLSAAASRGQTSIVAELLTRGADIAAKNAEQKTAADIAAKTPGMEKLVPFLSGEKPLTGLKAMAGQEKLDRAVVETAASGYAGYLKDALKKGGSANATGRTGVPVLALAKSETNAQILIDAGADVNARDANGVTVLMHACEAGNDEIVKTLLKAGADPTIADKDGGTAASRGPADCQDLVEEEIIRRGGSAPGAVAAFDKKKATRALFTAIRDDDPMGAVAALKKGADAYGAGRQGRNAMTASIADASPAVTAVLLAANIDIDRADSNGIAPVAQAYISGQQKRFAKLLEMGANPNVLVDNGRTLLCAAMINNGDSLDALLAARPDPNMADKDGLTAMQFAATNGGLAYMIQQLVDIGADVNAPDKDGNTPLMIALKDGKGQTVEALLNAGADVTPANAAGETAASLAKNFDLRVSHAIQEKLLASQGGRIAALEQQVRELSSELTRPQDKAANANPPPPAQVRGAPKAP